MQIAVVSEIPTSEQGGSGHSARKGNTVRQSIIGDDAPDGLNFRFIRSQYQSGEAAFESPRHHHAFQQIRWTQSGSVNYAPGLDIPEGDLAYFPRGAFYGPQRKDRGAGLLLQFGFHGEHQSGSKWTQHRASALAKLGAGGVFENGLYVTIDPVTGERMEKDGNQALYEAQYEERNQKKFTIPAEGYEAPILMHAAAFDYYEAAPGVKKKYLGAFYDHPGPDADLRISMVQLSGGGEHSFGQDRAQLAWTRAPGLTIEGRTYPELTCVYSPLGEKAVITGVDDVEVYVVEFPRLG